MQDEHAVESLSSSLSKGLLIRSNLQPQRLDEIPQLRR